MSGTINLATWVISTGGGGGGGGSATNLGVANQTDSTIDITSSTGTSATLPAATEALAGLMSAQDKVALDSISKEVDGGEF